MADSSGLSHQLTPHLLTCTGFVCPALVACTGQIASDSSDGNIRANRLHFFSNFVERCVLARRRRSLMLPFVGRSACTDPSINVGEAVSTVVHSSGGKFCGAGHFICPFDCCLCDSAAWRGARSLRYVISLFDSFPFYQILIHLVHTRLPRGKPSKASDLLRRATSSLPYPHWSYFTYGESAADEEEALPVPPTRG